MCICNFIRKHTHLVYTHTLTHATNLYYCLNIRKEGKKTIVMVNPVRVYILMIVNFQFIALHLYVKIDGEMCKNKSIIMYALHTTGFF